MNEKVRNLGESNRPGMTDNPAAAERVCQFLKGIGIAYQRHDHPPVTSCAQAAVHVRGVPGIPNKSLLLQSRDGQSFLVIMPCDYRLDLQQLAETLDCRRLSFANRMELHRLLGVAPGSVSPFGLIHDHACRVRVLIDSTILEQRFCQFHPNYNRAKLSLKTVDFLKFLSVIGHAPRVLDLR